VVEFDNTQKKREALMDISIIATIGFTTLAVIGILVLLFTGSKKKVS
jgi:flagellar basal body-associated protein FliL